MARLSTIGLRPRSRLRLRGFTIVEMIVVFSILAILSVIAAKTYTNVYNKAKLARVETGVNEVDAALQRFKSSNGGFYPGLAPWPVNLAGGSVAAYPRDRYFAGNRVIGGSAGAIDDPGKPEQDDYLFDKKSPRSPFRGGAFTASYPVYLSNPTQPNSQMKPVDALVGGGFFADGQYPPNPFKPGSSMVNVAYALAEYDRNTNSISLVSLPAFAGLSPRGVTIGRPGPGPGLLDLPGTYRYSLATSTWSNNAAARDFMQTVYPEGDFAYIPLGLKDPKAMLVTDYWLIGYGSLDTLESSPYNVWLQANPNGPDFPPPMGDNNPNNLTGYERSVRRMLTGALIVKGSKYTEQLDVSK